MERSLDEDATAETVCGKSVLEVALLPVQMNFGKCFPVAHVTGHGEDFVRFGKVVPFFKVPFSSVRPAALTHFPFLGHPAPRLAVPVFYVR